MPLAAVSCSSLLAQTSKTPGDDATLVRRTPQGGSPPPRCEPVAWAHISGEMIALDDGIEALEAVAHGYRAGGFVAGIAVHPPRRAMVQPAQARVPVGWGFCCFNVRPCSFFCRTSKTLT